MPYRNQVCRAIASRERGLRGVRFSQSLRGCPVPFMPISLKTMSITSSGNSRFSTGPRRERRIRSNAFSMSTQAQCQRSCDSAIASAAAREFSRLRPRERRSVGLDGCVQWNGRVLQLSKPAKLTSVDVWERTDGSVGVAGGRQATELDADQPGPASRATRAEQACTTWPDHQQQGPQAHGSRSESNQETDQTGPIRPCGKRAER